MHLITFQSTAENSQIDYFVVKGSDRSNNRDCKAIPFGGISTPHRLLLLDFVLSGHRRKRAVKMPPKIKWWRLSGVNGPLLRDRVLQEAERSGVWQVTEDADRMWVSMAACIRCSAFEVLGMSRGWLSRRKGVLWWSVEV